ncbi:MAG TPA: DNA gyrase subunit A, partial [Thermoanaerobacterales bacterium]|nr:DNA gyrase subunit A [Thermoanaerobacterales bacterium]
ENFNLSEKQAQVILDMKLQRLTALEQQKIEDEYNELLGKIDYYKKVLSDEQMVLSIIKEEILAIKEKFGDKRRSTITAQDGDIDIEDLIAEEDVVITLTHMGYIKRLPTATYRNQRRGGRGITGITTREEDFVEKIFVGTTHHVVLFFTDKGNVYKLKAYEIPETSRTARGIAIVNLLPLNPGEKVNAVMTINDFDDARYLLFATKSGMVKKTLLSEYASSRRTGLIAITLKDDDELIAVRLVNKNDHVMLGTTHGKGIIFPVEDVSTMGRTAQGVIGIRMDEGDTVASMDIVKEGLDVLVITEKGFGKRTALSEFRSQSRGGKGVIIQKTTEKTGKVTAIRMVDEDDELMLCTASGIMLRMDVSSISKMGRNTRGVTLIKLEKGDELASVAVVNED